MTTVESAEAPTDPKRHIKAVAPRIIVVALALVGLQALFAYSYMGAFGKPKTYQAPVIVVSSTTGNAGYIANKLNAAKGEPVLATVSTDKAAALAELKRDKAVAVYEFRPSLKEKTKDQLYYASAQGAARAQVATTIGQRVAKQGDRTLEVHDIVPARPDDPRGTAPFYLVLAWMVGAYILPATMATTIGARAQSMLGAWARLGLFVVYAVLSGIVGTWVATHSMDALGGDFWKIAAMGAVLVFAVSTFTYGLTSIFGTLGVGVAILLFVVLGNPSAGGAFNYDVLPEPWRSVGPNLPNGAGVDAVRSLAYFDGVDLKRPLWVVFAWFVAGLWMIFMVGNNTYRFARSGVSVPQDADAGLVGEHFEERTHELEAEPRGRHAARDEDEGVGGEGAVASDALGPDPADAAPDSRGSRRVE